MDTTATVSLLEQQRNKVKAKMRSYFSDFDNNWLPLDEGGSSVVYDVISSAIRDTGYRAVCESFTRTLLTEITELVFDYRSSGKSEERVKEENYLRRVVADIVKNIIDDTIKEYVEEANDAAVMMNRLQRNSKRKDAILNLSAIEQAVEAKQNRGIA